MKTFKASIFTITIGAALFFSSCTKEPLEECGPVSAQASAARQILPVHQKDTLTNPTQYHVQSIARIGKPNVLKHQVQSMQ